MSFTGQNCIDLARLTLNDDAKARYSDVNALKFLNAGLGALALIRPDLFIVTDELDTTADSAEQDIVDADDRAIKLYWIYRVVGGDVIDLCDMDALSRFYPGWMIAESATPENWMRHPEDAKKDSGTKYLLSPPPESGTQVFAKYSQAPAAIGLSDAVPVPDPYQDALAHYVIFRAESIDDEHVVTQRAQQALQVFLTSMGMGQESKVIVNDGEPQ